MSPRIPSAPSLARLFAGCLAVAAAPAAAEPPVTPDVPVESALTARFNDPALNWNPCPDFFPEGCGIAVVHGAPDAPGADLFFRVPGGAEIPAHWHTSTERMVLVSGSLQVRYTGQPAITLAPGDYAYGPARAVHDARCAPGDPCVLFIAFDAPVDAIAADDRQPGAASP